MRVAVQYRSTPAIAFGTFLVQPVQGHFIKNVPRLIQSFDVSKLSVLPAENFVHVSVFAKTQDRTNDDQVEVVPQDLEKGGSGQGHDFDPKDNQHVKAHLDYVAAEDSWACAHLWCIVNHEAVRI